MSRNSILNLNILKIFLACVVNCDGVLNLVTNIYNTTTSWLAGFQNLVLSTVFCLDCLRCDFVLCLCGGVVSSYFNYVRYVVVNERSVFKYYIVVNREGFSLG